MDDLISRQAAIDICANAIDLWHGQIGEGALVAVRDKIAELTPAEPKRGKWIDNGEAFICSECRSGYKEQPTLMGKPMFEFCPMCGAKMEVNHESN